MPDYSKYFRSKLLLADSWPTTWDVFISAFNQNERVTKVFSKVAAHNKLWVIHKEYGFARSAYPTDAPCVEVGGDEAAAILKAFAALPTLDASMKLVVDITGFMRPHIAVLTKLLLLKGISSFDVLYSEPDQYRKQEKTSFSLGSVERVRPIQGYEGVHLTDTSNDVLIVGSGYDSQLIENAADHKKSARKFQMLGLPSLRPDMYQENVLRARLSEEALGQQPHRDIFAPANDPFVIAEVLGTRVAEELARREITNLYLCPVATKPQALGFALYYLLERQGTATSLIFPFSTRYSESTSLGCSRVWQYRVEMSEASNPAQRRAVPER